MSLFAKRSQWGDRIFVYGTEKQLKRKESFYQFCYDMWMRKTGIKVQKSEKFEFEIRLVRKLK